MKIILKVLVLFILAIIIALLSSSGPGHVIMFIGHYRLDLSFITLLLITLIIYAILHYVLALIDGIYNIPISIRQRLSKRALIKSRTYFNAAATKYFLKEYKLAYSNALKSISQNVLMEDKFPVLLLAIDAIHLMDDKEAKETARMDKLLNRLHNNNERAYIYAELKKINEKQNNRFYSELLAKLQLQK